jgi:putative ABC transport system ATP-binding protein
MRRGQTLQVNLHLGESIEAMLVSNGGFYQDTGGQWVFICRPKLILADEPTGNLYSKNGEEVMEMLTKLNQEGATIVMVTHSDAHATYANRTIHLFDGNVVTEQMQEAYCA